MNHHYLNIKKSIIYASGVGPVSLLVKAYYLESGLASALADHQRREEVKGKAGGFGEVLFIYSQQHFNNQ